MLKVSELLTTERDTLALAAHLGVRALVAKGKVENFGLRETAAYRVLLKWRQRVATPLEAYRKLRGVLLEMEQDAVVAEVLDG